MPLAFFLLASTLFRIDPIAADAMKKMKGVSWHQGCPVPLTDLRQLTVTYLDFHSQPRQGILYVHKDVAGDLKTIFEKLYAGKFQIERMEPVEAFNGSDDASMAANNTSAFNCRDVTGSPGRFSNHSWGRAIDINPLTNPYVKGTTVLPPAGRQYLDRTAAHPGSILENSQIVKEFESRGWTWGGRWSDRKDYQHFEKPAR
ncbi:MAG TPA: M15 family metallopeptidase [Bryobacteraceae bacterium]|nr:M15 family metallopeptidase [Bryobacteraceae bacterium]